MRYIAGVTCDIGVDTFLRKLKDTIDGVVMIKKVNHLPVIEYYSTKDISFTDKTLEIAA